MPMAKQARQIWTEKLGLVHPLPFSGIIFTEIGHLATIPIFWSNQCKKVQIIKHEWTPEIYKIKLFCFACDYIIQHAHKKPKKKHPSQSSCNPLDAIIVSHVHKTTRPLPKFRAAKPTQQIATREQIELHPSQRDFSSPISHIYRLFAG